MKQIAYFAVLAAVSVVAARGAGLTHSIGASDSDVRAIKARSRKLVMLSQCQSTGTSPATDSMPSRLTAAGLALATRISLFTQAEAGS
jgi:hypothetical protein